MSSTVVLQVSHCQCQRCGKQVDWHDSRWHALACYLLEFGIGMTVLCEDDSTHFVDDGTIIATDIRHRRMLMQRSSGTQSWLSVDDVVKDNLFHQRRDPFRSANTIDAIVQRLMIDVVDGYGCGVCGRVFATPESAERCLGGHVKLTGLQVGDTCLYLNRPCRIIQKGDRAFLVETVEQERLFVSHDQLRVVSE